MFDQNELDELRDDQDSWQGHVDRERVTQAKTSKKIFFGTAMTSTVFVAMFVVLLFSGISAANFIGVAGIGGFAGEIEELDADGQIAIHPALGPSAACESDVDFGEQFDGQDNFNGQALPQLRAEVQNAVIPAGTSTNIIKDVATPSIGGADLGAFRINVSINPPASEDDLEVGDAVLYATALAADELNAGNAEVREFFADGSATNPRFWDGTSDALNDTEGVGEFAIRGEAAEAVLQGGEARVHYLAFDDLTVPDLELEAEYLSQTEADNEGITSDPANCPY